MGIRYILFGFYLFSHLISAQTHYSGSFGFSTQSIGYVSNAGAVSLDLQPSIFKQISDKKLIRFSLQGGLFKNPEVEIGIGINGVSDNLFYEKEVSKFLSIHSTFLQTMGKSEEKVEFYALGGISLSMHQNSNRIVTSERTGLTETFTYPTIILPGIQAGAGVYYHTKKERAVYLEYNWSFYFGAKQRVKNSEGRIQIPTLAIGLRFKKR
jgi:hypothetical protein